MPASSDRLGVSSLRPCTPAENDPADPNALTQSLQLTCSLTPSSTVPSTRLVIIWLKRCCARASIDPALESAPVGGGGAGVDGGVGGDRLCADALTVCAAISSSATAAVSSADTIQVRADLAIVSARTACRWDRCRHRREASPPVWRRHSR